MVHICALLLLKSKIQDMQNNNRAPTALIMKEYSHIKCQIKQQKLGFGFV